MLKNNLLRTLAYIPLGLAISLPNLKSPSNQSEPNRHDPFATLKHFQPHHSQSGLLALAKGLGAMNLAHAGAHSGVSLMSSIRNVIGSNLGYSSHANYVTLVCGGTDPGAGASCDGPPETGIVGAATTIINELPQIAGTAGIASCDSVPASGSANGTDSAGAAYTLNFQTPTHTVPSTWSNGGNTFDKRVAFTLAFAGATGVKAAYEFNCSNTAGYVALNMPMDNADGTFVRRIAIYSGQYSGNLNEFEVFLSEYSATDHQIRGAWAFRVQYDPSTSLFNLWGVANDAPGNVNLEEHFIVAGNYTTGQASVYADVLPTNALSGNNNAFDLSAIGAFSTVDTDTAGTATSFDFQSDLTSGGTTAVAGTEIKAQGCINFSTPTVAATSATLCDGLSLSAPSGAPSVDANGKLSVHWAINNLGTALETL